MSLAKPFLKWVSYVHSILSIIYSNLPQCCLNKPIGAKGNVMSNFLASFEHPYKRVFESMSSPIQSLLLPSLIPFNRGIFPSGPNQRITRLSHTLDLTSYQVHNWITSLDILVTRNRIYNLCPTTNFQVHPVEVSESYRNKITNFMIQNDLWTKVNRCGELEKFSDRLGGLKVWSVYK